MADPAPMPPAGDFDLKTFLPYLLNISGEVTSRGFERSY